MSPRNCPRIDPLELKSNKLRLDGTFGGSDMKEYGQDIETLGNGEACRRIRRLTSGLMNFCKGSHGWAPMEVAGGMAEKIHTRLADLTV
jgi:hypothetical protein